MFIDEFKCFDKIAGRPLLVYRGFPCTVRVRILNFLFQS